MALLPLVVDAVVDEEEALDVVRPVLEALHRDERVGLVVVVVLVLVDVDARLIMGLAMDDASARVVIAAAHAAEASVAVVAARARLEGKGARRCVVVPLAAVAPLAMTVAVVVVVEAGASLLGAEAEAAVCREAVPQAAVDPAHGRTRAIRAVGALCAGDDLSRTVVVGARAVVGVGVVRRVLQHEAVVESNGTLCQSCHAVLC